MDYKNFPPDGMTYDHLFLLIVASEVIRQDSKFNSGIDIEDLFNLLFMVSSKIRKSQKEFYNFPFFTTVSETRDQEIKGIWHYSLKKILANTLDKGYLIYDSDENIHLSAAGKVKIQQDKMNQLYLKNSQSIQFFSDSFYHEIVRWVKYFLQRSSDDLCIAVRKTVSMNNKPEGFHFHRLEVQ